MEVGKTREFAEVDCQVDEEEQNMGGTVVTETLTEGKKLGGKRNTE